ncbi:MAG: hypothetical protein ACFE95_04860 [Candidatus Hodarchaeota archaeon]
MDFNVEQPEKYEPSTRKERILEQGIKILFLVLGIALTYIILILNYQDEALVKFFKGISVQNLIDIIIEVNLSELLILIYYIVLFGILIIINDILKVRFLFPHLNPKKQSIVSSAIGSFREGSFTIPVVIMIGFPLLLQIILPLMINIVVVVELLVPFIIMGELYYIFQMSLKKIIQNREEIINNPSHLLSYLAGLVLSFPLGVYFFLETGLAKFFNVIHYNFMWENPDSSIAIMFWEMVNNIISILSFNNTSINSIFEEIKYFIVAFIVLLIMSNIYLFLKQFLKIQAVRQVERFILIYE